MRFDGLRLPCLALMLGVLVSGCGNSGALLSDVRGINPPLTARASTKANRLDVAYTLTSPAQVSAYLEAQDGRRWPIHDGAVRPLKGDYRIGLDGTVPGPGPNERRALPDGDYRVVVQAESGEVRQEASTVFQVRGADTDPPRIEGLELFPERISPNFDAIDDVSRVTYRVTKRSRVLAFADLVMPDGQRKRAWTGEERQVEAGEQRLMWFGTLNSQPLPDGLYDFGVRAEDDAGNVSEARASITLEAGGTPEAKVVQAQITPRQVIRGELVCLDMVIRNTGQTILRTQGPDPSYVYSSFDSYSSIENHGYQEKAGFWRVGLDASGFASTTGSKYPWRWGFGKDLAPGEEVPVRGCVRVEGEQNRLVFFSSLIQENVAILDAGAGMTEVRVTP